MRVGTRILFSLFIVIILVICAGIIVASLGLIDGLYAEGLLFGFLYTDYKYIWAGAAAVMFVVGVILLFFRSGKSEPRSVILSENSDGNVTITIAAVEELEARYLSSITGVIVQKIRVYAEASGTIKTSLELCVKPGVEIPNVTAQIKTEIVEYIRTYTGLETVEAAIRIMPMKNSAAK